MILYAAPYAPIPDRVAMEALMPPARRSRLEAEAPSLGPLFAYALLARALEQHCSISAYEALAFTTTGRPYLPGTPVHLSLSHSKTHALCAVAPFPVGCDIETHRPVSERVRRRVLGAGEAPEDFFALWTLTESYFKLGRSAGDAVLSVPPFENAEPHSWLYREIPDCTAAVAAHEPFPRPALRILPPETLFSYAAEKIGLN